MTMTTNEILKRQILYRSTHRGTKEMDLILGDFVKRYLHTFDNAELRQLDSFLKCDDESIFNLYHKKKLVTKIPENNVTKLFTTFKVRKL